MIKKTVVETTKLSNVAATLNCVLRETTMAVKIKTITREKIPPNQIQKKNFFFSAHLSVAVTTSD